MAADGKKTNAAACVVYWEEQTRANCAVHACNNLIQVNTFCEKDFDHIANALDYAEMELIPQAQRRQFVSQNRNILGNYSVQVITQALGKVIPQSLVRSLLR